MANQCHADGCNEAATTHGFCARHSAMLLVEHRSALGFSASQRDADGYLDNVQAAKTYLKNREVELSKFVAIRGKTFHVKDSIKALGGVWDGTVWRVPKDKAAEARALVKGARR